MRRLDEALIDSQKAQRLSDDPEHSIAIRLEAEYWLAQAEIELTAINGR